MAKADMERGSTGRLVAENVRRVRDEKRLSLEDLAQRLAAAGWPIIPSGLSKLERGQRRIDVDDLVALGSALDVLPADLLLKPGGTYEQPDVSMSELERHIDLLAPVITAAIAAVKAGVEPRIVEGAARVARSRALQTVLLAGLAKDADDGR